MILRADWQPSPRFAEAAAALALAYLALEILAFPQSRGRWLLGAAVRRRSKECTLPYFSPIPVIASVMSYPEPR